MTVACLDIETTLAHDHIWMWVITGVDQAPVVGTTAEELRSALLLGNYTVITGHNLLGFDLPLLDRLWEVNVEEISGAQIVDTLVLGRLLYPSVTGGHSLKAWCKRAGLPEQKDDFDKADFDRGYDIEVYERMQAYCKQDTVANLGLYHWMVDELKDKGFDQRAVDLEHKVRVIVQRQEDYGFCFDEMGGMELHQRLAKEQRDIEDFLQESFPPIVHERYSEKTGKRLKDKVEVFNPGSRPQIAERLAGLGVKWKEKTETGRPKVSESTLEPYRDTIPEADAIYRYLSNQKLLGMTKSWLDNCTQGRIHGRVLTNGTVTGRMTHTAPNLAQIPAQGQCRELFTASPGRVLVGCDAEQLELRMLAHFMKDDAYTESILHGDIHWVNAQAAGFAEAGVEYDEHDKDLWKARQDAKRFIYAFLYGAGDALIGDLVGGGMREGQAIKARFLAQVPALANLLKKLDKIVAASTIHSHIHGGKIASLPGLDGRRIWVRHEHAKLNTLLQGAGAVFMKQALVRASDSIRDLDAEFVVNVHDEWQLDVAEQDAPLTGTRLEEAMVQAGVDLNLRCPTVGQAKYGTNWSETH